MIPPLLDIVTVDDIVRAGACVAGARQARDRIAPGVTAARVAELLPSVSGDSRSWLLEAAGMAGYGSDYDYGDGSCSGYGSDDGDGSGDGYGYGYGDGSSSGDGYGYGYGYASGYGCGYGYGRSYGDGYGCGYGYGNGSGRG